MNKEKKKYIQLNKKQRGILISHIWGISEIPFWMTRCEYYNSASTKSKSGMIMATYSAVYIFRSKLMKGIRLRHIFNVLKCTSIEQSGDTIIFTMPVSVQNAYEKKNKNNNIVDFQANDKNKAIEKEQDEIEKKLLSEEDSLVDLDLETDSDDSLSSDTETDKKKKKSRNSKKKEQKKKKNYMEKYNLPDSDFKLRVDTSNASELVYMLLEIMQDAIYGVKNSHLIKPKIKCEIQRPKKPTKRPEHSLERRALFLSHYDPNTEANRIFTTGKDDDLDEKLFEIVYSAKSRIPKNIEVANKLKTGLDSCDYFVSNWDGNPVLTIGKEFHPTVFGHAYGRAVGWETSLTTVVFRSANFSHFQDFLRSLISYSETIDKIIFLDYERGQSLNFNLALYKDDSFKGNDTTIKKWWFLNTSVGVIVPFFRSAGQLSKPFEELVISRYSYSKEDTKRIFNQIQAIPILHNSQNIKFVSLKFREFPYMTFKSMCSTFKCLTTLYLKNMVNCDGNLLLSVLFESNPRIHQISLIKMRFESNMKQNLYLPKGLIFLDVSKSQFINTSFASFLTGITSRPVATPFIFSARKLKIGDDEFSYIQSINLDKCQPNFLEVNLSHNHIPALDDYNIFTFLATQKNLKHIVLFDVTTDDQANFVKSVIELCHSTNIEGLDIGVHFENTIIQTFISLLSRCESLTRLSINNCGAGNDGLVVLCSMFNLLGQLREFACDGFRPKPLSDEEIRNTKSGVHPLIELWRKIGESKKIERNDWPKQDLVISGINLIPKNRKDEIWINALKSRKPPKTQQERIQIILDDLKLKEERRREQTLKKSKAKKMNRIGFDMEKEDGNEDEYEFEEEEEEEEGIEFNEEYKL